MIHDNGPKTLYSQNAPEATVAPSTEGSCITSLDHSETSVPTPEPGPLVTASQRGIHAAVFSQWYQTHSALRHSHDQDLQKRGTRMAACCCCPIYCLTANASLKLAPGFCRDRLCPTCRRRRSRRTFHDLCAHVGAMDSPRFITLTQKAKNEPLFLSLARLRGNFKTLRKNPIWKDAVRGGIYAIEVTRNTDTKLWHVHMHIVADGDFLAQKRLSEAWQHASGDSYIVDIRAIHSKTQVASYVTKYISKPTDLSKWPTHKLEEYARDMQGVRMIHTFGNRHNRNTEPGDDCCIVQRAEPLVSAATVLKRLRAGCTHAANAVHLMNRMGGQFRRSLGLPQPPEDDETLPLLPDEIEELVNHLRSMSKHQSVTEIPRAVWRMADLRCDECPWR